MDTKNDYTPKRRFPGFEGEWKQKEFGRMFQKLQTGTNLLGSEQGRGIPLLKMGNIQRGYWNLTKLERLDQEIERENIIKYGDFLFNTRNTLELVGKGATWFIQEGLYGFNSNLARVTFENVDTIFFNYLYNIPENIQQVKSRAVGTTSVAAIYPKDMVSIKFQLPTIDEQKKLGNFFQTIDSLISLHQHKLDKLKDLKKAYLTEMFPAEGERVPKRRFPGFEGEWEQKKLGDISEIYDGTHQTPRYTHKGVMFLSVENIKTLKSNKYISKDDFIKDFKIFPQNGDVLMTRIGDIGTSNVVNTDSELAFYVSLALIRSSVLDSNFLNFSISSSNFQKELWRRTLHIAFPKKINKNEIGEVSILFPCIAEQKQIGEFFHKLDNSITLQQQKLDKLNDLKKAYLNELFV